ncbi:helix-turn-helix transcriptional regulator [Paenibacillus sp. MMO-58]|uniref:helix-turn-helix transcriptional regulator n=1 Tax=Paenibacillus sp. MMO-58 TaxID=3081290 RepID=UPI003FA78AB1
MVLPRMGRCRLSEHLNRIGMSQAEFARRINLSEPVVSRLVSGQKKLNLERALQASYILACTVEELYELEFQ